MNKEYHLFVSNQHQVSTAAFAQDTASTTGTQKAAPASGYKDANFRDLDNTSWVLAHWTNGNGKSHPGFPQDPHTSNPITLDLKMTDQDV